MKTKTQILVYLIGLAFLDMIIPIPFSAFLLIYVLLETPPWFERLVVQIYDQKGE